MTVEYLWMEHAETRGRAVLPDIPYWRAVGWHPCDGPPPEVDLTRDENTTRPEPSSSPEHPGFFVAPDQVDDQDAAPEVTRADEPAETEEETPNG